MGEMKKGALWPPPQDRQRAKALEELLGVLIQSSCEAEWEPDSQRVSSQEAMAE